MKLSILVMIQAVTCLALGIAFTLYAPLMMAFFAIPDALDSPLAYWQVAAFARMFGVALLGFGLLLLAVRGFVDKLAPNSTRGILSALLLANLLGAIVAVTQQQSVWQTAAGWMAVLLYTVFFIGYAIAYGQSQKKEGLKST